MSATDELRRLLDEQGIEYREYQPNPFEETTAWDLDVSDIRHEVCASFEEFDRGSTLLKFWNCTPEQAIAATLGGADLAAENAELREDLEFERSENGWVREFLNRMGQKCGTEDCPSLVAYVTKLESENAKLRELVRNLLRVVPRDVSGVVIGAHSEHPTYYSFADAMRELGVEVDG